MKKTKIKSLCKINLSLRVLGKLNNNYHSINSLITFCNLHDVVSIYKTNNPKDVITFSGKFKNGINKKSNTITKVFQLLRKKKLLLHESFNVNVKKNIPHGSGLGGGSSNAADLLNFMNFKMNLKLNKKKIIKIANQIGFDVPINLEKKNTLIMGKKNEIFRLNQKFKLVILIVYPNIICSTKKIYKKNNKFSLNKYKPNILSQISNKKKLIFFLENEKNDLEDAVVSLYPKIGNILDFIRIQKGCNIARITGSGSACIGIFSNINAAIFTQKLIKSKFPKCWSFISKTI